MRRVLMGINLACFVSNTVSAGIWASQGIWPMVALCAAMSTASLLLFGSIAFGGGR
jgi:hypothetical protein